MAQQFPRPTKTYRSTAYPAISPTRPELRLDGQTVLITGGATGIGLETTRAFAAAGASKIVLIARRQPQMTEAKLEVEAAFPGVTVVPYAVSVANFQEISDIIEGIGIIDVLVLNAGVLPKPQPILALEPDDLANAFNVNVFGPLNLIRAFMKLPARSTTARRTIIYTSAYGINIVHHGVSGYNASKAAMTYIMRCIDEEYADTGVRSFAFHPCVAYTPMARDSLGLPPDALVWDSLDLPAQYAVWLCSPEADFVKGRFVSANWDVQELEAKKQAILQDPSLLKIAVHLGKLVE